MFGYLRATPAGVLKKAAKPALAGKRRAPKKLLKFPGLHGAEVVTRRSLPS